LNRSRRGFAILACAVALGGCHHRAAVIEPVPETYKTDWVLPEPDSGTIAVPDVVSDTRTVRGAKPAAARKPPPPPPAQECAPPVWRTAANSAFGEQERFRFDVRWGLIKAGQATLAVEGVEAIRKRPAYHLSMDIQATGMTGSVHPYRDRTDSWLDKASLTALLSRHSIRESHYQADETTVFDWSCRRFHKRTLRLDKATREDKDGPLPPDVLDIYGALYYLRTLPLKSGASFELALFAGDKVFPVTAQVVGEERVKVAAGKFNCYRIEIKTGDPAAAAKVRGIQWWVSADEAHRPVRIRMDVAIGHITADLVE
jgi:hypothetical protein